MHLVDKTTRQPLAPAQPVKLTIGDTVLYLQAVHPHAPTVLTRGRVFILDSGATIPRMVAAKSIDAEWVNGRAPEFDSPFHVIDNRSRVLLVTNDRRAAVRAAARELSRQRAAGTPENGLDASVWRYDGGLPVGLYVGRLHGACVAETYRGERGESRPRIRST